MSETSIRCPNCGTEIPVSEALSAQIRRDLENTLRLQHEAQLRCAVEQARSSAQQALTLELADLKVRLAEKDKKAETALADQLELRKRARELEEQNRQLAEKVRDEVEQALRKEADERIKAAAAQAEARARASSDQEMKFLKEQLGEQSRKAEEAQHAELVLRKEKADLEERSRELDLEVLRRVDAEKRRLEEAIRKAASEEQALKLKEKEKQIDDLRQALEDAKRRSELGSQELQGEVLELDIQAALDRLFPQDRIEPVLKGVRGADIVQRVRNERLDDCGAIVWETKNAKNWSAAWIDKLKQDQRAAGAAVAVIVSVALPENVPEFGRIDGVWVASRRSYPALAVALREQLIQVAYARAASAGKHEKMELLYEYLSGNEFRQRVEAIVEAFAAMQDQLTRERRAMERQWAEREKQIQRVVASTTRMYGALQGIVGSGMPAIPALELDSMGLLPHRSGPRIDAGMAQGAEPDEPD
jgi:hypothetical protein